MTDVHNHLHQLPDPAQVFAESQSAGVQRMLVNGTSEKDWEQVEKLCRQHPVALLPSFGLHPWQVPERTDHWLESLRTFLMTNPGAAVGECGLDRWQKPFDLPEQIKCLQDQIDLARELTRPLTIHCLQAWGPLFELLSAQKTCPPFLLHAYSGSTEMMRQLAGLGAYFSFNGYFLHERKAAIRDTFRQIPAERLLLESDAPAMLPPPDCVRQPLPEAQNHPANLMGYLEPLAKLRGTDSAALRLQLEENFHNFHQSINIQSPTPHLVPPLPAPKETCPLSTRQNPDRRLPEHL